MCVTAITSENVTAINNYLNVSNYNTYEPQQRQKHEHRYGVRRILVLFKSDKRAAAYCRKQNKNKSRLA